jgi:hypothetical protein
MCAQRDALMERRLAARCLSSVCRAAEDPTIQALTRFYQATLEEPVPEGIRAAMDRLGTQH